MSGGNEKTQWFASGGYFNQDGTTIATNFKRYNGNINVTSKLNEKITFSAGIQGSYSNQIAPPGSAAYASPVSGAFFLPPFYSPYNTDGSLRYGPDHDSLNEFPAGAQFNPLAIAQWNRYTDAQTQFRGFVSGEYQIIPNLKFTSRYSAEYLDYNEYVYWNPIYGDGYPLGYGDASNTKIYGWTWTNQLNYKVNLNKEKDFYLDLLAATEAYEKNTFVLNAQGNNFPSTTLLTYLTSAASPIGAFTVPTSNSLISYFSNAALNYKDRYVLTGSFRRDGASIWAQGHQWGNFYSVGGTWNINEEEFMSTLPVFSLLKLRASYGTQGNSAGFGNYTSIPTYGFSTAYRGNAGSNPNNVGNPLLTWETNKEFNVGLDWGLLKNRISGTIEYYKRTTDGLVLNVPLSPTSGFASQNQNVGSMYNQGIEFSITGKPVVTRDFTWTSSFNISHNKNRVTKLYNHVPVSQQTRFDVTEGHDVREFYTRLWANANPANGNPQWYTDATKKTITSTSSQVSLSLTGKSASPKYYGAWTNTFTYKGFSLEAQLYYNFGNYIYSTWENYLESDGLYLGNTGQLSNSLRGWKKAGDVTPVPAQIAGGNMNSNVPSTRYLYKGNYIRLRDVQLDYSIPKSAISKANITNITVYVRGTNLLTFATDKYLAFDPEIGASSIGDFQVFMPKTISAGVKLGF
jgi:TonB-linked SusC/RagA family outer membrane protein